SQEKKGKERPYKVLAAPGVWFDHELTESGCIIRNENRFCQVKSSICATLGYIGYKILYLISAVYAYFIT
ncbi:MAG: hypothetical protein WAU81_03510, partial [Candidatus Aminicenantales bacterium]